jgi:uncharacterized protein involved in exopolysaccharide biosynthesis
MTEPNGGRFPVYRDDEEISLFALGTTLLRNRWRIVRWMAVGAVLAGLTVITKPKVYAATASFIPQWNDASRSGLAGLAGQFGVSLPVGNQSLSPEFYANLVKSRVLLEPIVRDTFVVAELGGKRASFLDLFGVKGESPRAREEAGVKMLAGMVVPSIGKSTGVVQLSVSTTWRSVSLAIVSALVDGINSYNQRTRQSQAEAERKFIEGRLAVASADLRAAEDGLAEFLATNRMLGNSQMLAHDRLQRDLVQKQLVYNSLTQAYEDARIREVRDTPVISIFEPPEVPTQAEARGRLNRTLLGVALGGLIGVLLVFTQDMLARRRQKGDIEAEEFVGALGTIKDEMSWRVRRLMGHNRR